MGSKKHLFLNRCIYPVLEAFKIPQLVQWLLNTRRVNQCKKNATVGSGSGFHPLAIVHNPARDPSRIRIGINSFVDGELLIHDYGGKIEIGDYCYVGLGSRVWSGESVKIGNHVFLAHNVNITDTNSHQFNARERMEHYIRTVINHLPFEKGTIKTAPVIIEDHAWINFGVGILKGVRIGEGAVVGAQSLVTHDVPPYTLVAGNPARVIRKLEGKA